jgi:hypothetical protein
MGEKALNVGAIVLIGALLLILTVLVGVTMSSVQAIGVAQRTRKCSDSVALMDRYCTNGVYFRTCFDMVSSVEELLALGSQDAIFAELRRLEQQGAQGRNQYSLWAVDESVEDSNSHQDLSTKGVVQLFNNSAYYYSRRAHVDSLRCGGWSLSFWKTFPGANTTRSLQLAYCSDQVNIQVRVCGAFNVIQQPETQ